MERRFSIPHFQSEVQHRPASGARAWPERRRRAGVEGFSGQGPGFHAEYGGCPFGSERNRASRRRQGPAAGGGAPVRAREGVARPKPGGRACGIPSPPSADGGEAPQGGRARAKASAGVRWPGALRGRAFRMSWTRFTRASVTCRRSVPFGRYRGGGPLVCPFRPRSHEW